MAAIQWLCLLLFQPTGLTPLLAVLHLYTFDPAWVRAGAAGDGPAMVFYDGSCALCHGSVRFVLAEDRAGNTFRFAPLDSAALRRSVTEERRRTLPDSIVVQRHDGTLLMRSGAVLYALRRLGGLWRPLAAAGGIVPRLVRDRVYEGIAAVRYRVFGRTVEACPIMPPDLRSRFDLE